MTGLPYNEYRCVISNDHGTFDAMLTQDFGFEVVRLPDGAPNAVVDEVMERFQTWADGKRSEYYKVSNDPA
jgi:hypothetical protein